MPEIFTLDWRGEAIYLSGPDQTTARTVVNGSSESPIRYALEGSGDHYATDGVIEARGKQTFTTAVWLRGDASVIVLP